MYIPEWKIFWLADESKQNSLKQKREKTKEVNPTEKRKQEKKKEKNMKRKDIEDLGSRGAREKTIERGRKIVFVAKKEKRNSLVLENGKIIEADIKTRDRRKILKIIKKYRSKKRCHCRIDSVPIRSSQSKTLPVFIFDQLHKKAKEKIYRKEKKRRRVSGDQRFLVCERACTCLCVRAFIPLHYGRKQPKIQTGVLGQ